MRVDYQGATGSYIVGFGGKEEGFLFWFCWKFYERMDF